MTSSSTQVTSNNTGYPPIAEYAENHPITHTINLRTPEADIKANAEALEGKNKIASLFVKGAKGAVGAVGFSASLIAAIPAVGIFLVQEGTMLLGKGVLGGIGGFAGLIGGAFKGDAIAGAKSGYEKGKLISNATVGTIVHLVGGLVKTPFTLAGLAGATLARWGFEEKEKEKEKGTKPLGTPLQFLHSALNQELLFCADKIKDKTGIDLLKNINEAVNYTKNKPKILKEYTEGIEELGKSIKEQAHKIRNRGGNDATPILIEESDDGSSQISNEW